VQPEGGNKERENGDLNVDGANEEGRLMMMFFMGNWRKGVVMLF